MARARKYEYAPTYQGRPCRTCGSTEKYASGRTCVPCAKRRGKERSQRRRDQAKAAA